MEEGVLVTDHKQDTTPNIPASKRLQICRSCPLFMADISICNPNLWFNPATFETSKKAKAGFVRGCGCLLTRKVKQKSSHCHAGLW